MSGTAVTLKLKRGHAKPLYSGHPWVFADAVDGFDGPRPAAGDEVRVVDERGTCLGRGFLSPDSAIAVRLLTHEDEACDETFLARRIDEALAMRAALVPITGSPPTRAYRLIHSEGDGLGGLIVDRFDAYLSVQFGSAGMDRRRETLLELLRARLPDVQGIVDKSDRAMLRKEGIVVRDSAILYGEAPDGPLAVDEHGVIFLADLLGGQKTGHYLDQRENRLRFAAYAPGRDVLDVFSYTGGFSLYAANRGQAKSITLVDGSEPALSRAKDNLARNGIADADLICADWKKAFAHLQDQGRSFDLLALDPPKFAPNRAAVRKALEGYRHLNARALELLRPGGILFTCSCSGSVNGTDFERTVARAVTQTGRRARLLERREAAVDHPVPPGFDQGRYLKCLVLEVR